MAAAEPLASAYGMRDRSLTLAVPMAAAEPLASAHGIGMMVIGKLLQPFRHLRHETHLLRRLYTAVLGFRRRPGGLLTLRSRFAGITVVTAINITDGCQTPPVSEPGDRVWFKFLHADQKMVETPG